MENKKIVLVIGLIAAGIWVWDLYQISQIGSGEISPPTQYLPEVYRLV